MKASFTPPTVLKPSVPVDLERVILRCLRKNPADRYPSMNALIADLDELALRIGAPDRRKPAISRKTLIGAAALLLLIAELFF